MTEYIAILIGLAATAAACAAAITAWASQKELTKHREQWASQKALIMRQEQMNATVREAGVVGVYRRRDMALQILLPAIDAETKSIMIVGSSLKGLLQREFHGDVAEILCKKIKEKVNVKFLLTHPCIADLRAAQEDRRPTEIGQEIIQSLTFLKELGVPPQNVCLYKGTPTCFAILTSEMMLINPYTYLSVSFDSPCIIVETSEAKPSYFYNEYVARHFAAWDSSLSARVWDYDVMRERLLHNLPSYADNIRGLLGRE